MKVLYLMRHAKALKDPNLKDFDRPLVNRGYTDLTQMSERFKKLGMFPDVIYTSPAKRAFDSALHFKKELKLKDENLIQHQDIYNASVEKLLEVLKKIPNTNQQILLIGHNPGLINLINHLISTQKDHLEHLSTSGIVEISLDIADWKNIAQGTGRLVWFDVPRRKLKHKDSKHAYLFKNREMSWLSFNERVLQEAGDENVPLLERLKFLGIFSSNLDEFFRVRVATITRIINYGAKSKKLLGYDPGVVLRRIQNRVLNQQKKFDHIYYLILKALTKEKIHFIVPGGLQKTQKEFVTRYFENELLPSLVPIMLDEKRTLPDLKDRVVYFLVGLSKKTKPRDVAYALIELPKNLSRFLILPLHEGRQDFMLLDDVIRFSLPKIFSIFEYNQFEAYSIKMTRDAEITFDLDLSKDFVDMMSKTIEQRRRGQAVRLTYDRKMPKEMQDWLFKKLQIKSRDHLTPGGRYDQFSDFMRFPNIGSKKLFYEPLTPLVPKELKNIRSYFDHLDQQNGQKEILLHFPYQSFDHFLNFLREAAIDPKVTKIKITLYRLAKESLVVNTLLNAVLNGKEVVVLMELQARFDEEANIYWAKRLREAGAKVIYGKPRQKVHCKLCLIYRKNNSGNEDRFAYFGTGNFNEVTAKTYSDVGYFTKKTHLTAEAGKLFEILEKQLKTFEFKHLLVAPIDLREKIMALIDYETNEAKANRPAKIYLKLNSLLDEEGIIKLYEASRAGVEVRLIVRGICGLVPHIKNLSEKIEAFSIVDKFLEHSRLFYFWHGGQEKTYISSADLMTRNIDHRIEVACPIESPELKKELKQKLELFWRDNTKSRLIDHSGKNHYKQGTPKYRAQKDIYEYLKNK